MTYMLIKSLHIVAMSVWIGGMLMLAVIMATWKRAPRAEVTSGQRLFAAVQRWNQTVTLPAMIVTWITGVALTMMGNWPPTPWLIAKFLLVVVLSALHGIQSGSFRRSLGQPSLIAPEMLRYAAGFTLVALVLCVVLIEL